eukprot:c28358_g1_i1 orf=341-3013(+)
MEMDDIFETRGSSLVTVERQGFCLGCEDIEYQAIGNSSDGSGLPNVTNGSALRKIRMDEGELKDELNLCRTECCRYPTTTDPSHSQSRPGTQRPMRESCVSLIQGQWDTLNGIPGTLAEPVSNSSRLNPSIGGRWGPNSIPYLSMDSNAVNQGFGMTDFKNFGSSSAGQSSNSYPCFTSCWPSAGNDGGEIASISGNRLEEERVAGSWSGDLGHNLSAQQWQALDSDMILHSGGSTLEEKCTGNAFEMDTCFIAGTSLEDNMECSDSSYTVLNTNGDASRADGICSLTPSLSVNSSHLSWSEGGQLPLFVGGMVGYSAESFAHNHGHLHGGRRVSFMRNSCERNSSLDANITGFLPFCPPQSSGTSNNTFGRPVNGAGSSRLDTGNSTIAATATSDVCQTTSSASMANMWGYPNDVGNTLGIEREHWTESCRAKVVPSLPSCGINTGSERNVHIRHMSKQPEQNLSQLHGPSLGDIRRSLHDSQFHALSSRQISPLEQPMKLSTIISGSSSASSVNEIDRFSASVSTQMNIGTSIVGSKRRHSLFSRGDNHHSRVSPRIPGMFEGNQMRNLPAGSLSLLSGTVVDNRLQNHTNLNSAGQTVMPSTRRIANGPKNQIHISEGGSFLALPGSANSQSAPNFSAHISTCHNTGTAQGHTVSHSMSSTVMTSNDPVPSFLATALDAVPSSSAVFQGQHHRSVAQTSLHAGGHAEGIPVPPLHRLLGMPFRGLHMLSAGRENRHRALSEVLSALERARRNTELSFEEMVMLDPSVIFGGIDMHDQHSDMRLDVDNMSYEELLALEERIGDVSTGLSEETISNCLETRKYTSLDATFAAIFQESEVKCSICQEEYVEEEDLSRLACSHRYHTACIRQWLLQKNQCPICKATAYSKA